MEKLETFIAFINTGGPINWLILGLYLADLGIVSERGAYFFRTRRPGAVLLETLRTGDFAASSERVKNREKRSPLYRIAEVFSCSQSKPEPALMEIIDREAALMKKEMERGLAFLTFAAAAAPLLGLLGTITGLMNAFAQIENRGAAVDIAFLSGGIKEAMTTTATGLVTAICAMGFGKLFEHLSASRLDAMAVIVSFLTQQLREERG